MSKAPKPTSAAELKRERASLVKRLRARPEIERAIVEGVRAEVPDSTADRDSELARGLAGAVAALIPYMLAAIKAGAPPSKPPPAAALEQARRLARSGVGVDMVVRRYVEGNEILRDFVAEEANSTEVAEDRRNSLERSVAKIQHATLQHLTKAISEAYKEEARSAAERGADVSLVNQMAKNEAGARQLIARWAHPLDQFRVEGYKLRETAEVYLSLGYNASSTANKLRVARGTVSYRLNLIEKALGCPIRKCQDELLTAIKLERLLAPTGRPRSPD